MTNFNGPAVFDSNVKRHTSNHHTALSKVFKKVINVLPIKDYQQYSMKRFLISFRSFLYKILPARAVINRVSNANIALF